MSTLKSLTRQDWLLALTGTYCVISVMMNYLCMKPMSFGTGVVWMDGGLLVSWIVFLLSNVVVEAYDKRTAIWISAVATLVALMVSLIAVLEVHLPTLPAYEEQATHFAHIFSNGPRSIISSAIAFFIGNWVNITIIARMKKCDEHRMRLSSFWWRAFVSTLIGQAVDNFLFQTFAFAPIGLSVYEMYWHDIWTAVGLSTAFETLVETLFVPLITLPLAKYLLTLPLCSNLTRQREDSAASQH